jgi:predicted SAM-dependent methyltransferase
VNTIVKTLRNIPVLGWLIQVATAVNRRWQENKEFRLFKEALQAQQGKPLRVVVGASGVFQPGWIPSEAHYLNLLDDRDWQPYFQPDSIQTILAEHVWEHLWPEDGYTAARTCFKYIAPGGRLRVAVPDGFHSDPTYIEWVRPGGNGVAADDHKLLYNYKTFSDVFEKAGFKVHLLEYFDEQHNFHHTDWDKAEGMIHRSIRYDKRNADGQPHYTSIIIDAVKDRY